MRRRVRRIEPFADVLRALARTRELPIRRQRRAIERVVREWTGGCEIGRYWADDILRALSEIRLRDGAKRGTVRRSVEGERKCLEFLIRRVAGMRRAKDGSIRALDRDVVWQGRTRAPVTETDEIERALECAGLGASIVACAYCPARSQGGFAGRMQRSVRQCARYAVVWREAELLASEQPPIGADDAVAPRAGDWSYAQWWLVRRPPASVLRALRIAWGEVYDTPLHPEPERARPALALAPPAQIATPPPLDREALAREAAKIASLIAP